MTYSRSQPSSPASPLSRPTTALVWGALSLLTLGWSTASAELARRGNWVLTGELNSTVFADSNPNADEVAKSTLGLTVEPSLLLQRVNSRTRAELYTRLTPTWFDSSAVSNQTDFSLGGLWAYPVSEDGLPRTRAEASYRKYTQASATLGRRIEARTLQAQATQRFLATGKLGAQGTFNAYQTDYSGQDLNTNREGRLGLAARYEPTPLTEYTLGLAHTVGTSSPDVVGRPDRHMNETSLVLGLLGKVLPLVEVEGYLGLGSVRYKDDIARTDWKPVAGLQATWSVTGKTRLRGGLEARSDFSPNGDAQASTRLSAEAITQLSSQWRVLAGGSVERADFTTTRRYRSDDRYGLRGQLTYTPSRRLSVAVTSDYTDQQSDLAGNEFQRWQQSVSVSFRF